jgi:hypothetical protein
MGLMMQGPAGFFGKALNEPPATTPRRQLARK